MGISTITMRFGDKPRGANELSTWNGVTLNIGRPEKIASLIKVQVAQSQSKGKGLTNNFITLTQDAPGGYAYNGASISLTNFHNTIKVTYNEPEQTQAGFEASSTDGMIAFQKIMISELGNPLKGSAETLKIQEVTGNSSSFNSIGAVLGGFKGLTGGAKPTKDFVKRVRLAQLQPGAVDGSADKTSSQTTALTTLFKKNNLSSTGNLNKVVFTQGSVNSILNELKTHTTASSTKIRAEGKTILPASLSVKVIDQAVAAIKDTDNGITPQSKMTKEVSTTIKNSLRDVQNAGLKLNPDAQNPAASRSNTNLFANLIGNKLGIKSNMLGNIKDSLLGTAPGIVIPSGVKVPNLIEGFDEFTKKQSFNTNTSKLISKGSLTPNMSLTNITSISSNKSGWRGYLTSDSYKFEYVDTADELESEFENSSRFKTGPLNNVIAIIIGWTDKVWGPPEKVNAKSIHEISKQSDVTNLIKKEGSAAKAIAKIQSSSLLHGIQSHYIILTDGRIQRGRPIDQVRNPDTSSFDLTGVQVTLVANNANPANPEQVLALGQLISKAYKVLPGVNLFGENEMDNTKTGPGIDIASLRDKYGKTNSIDNPEEGGNGPSRKEIAYIQPQDIAKGSQTKSVKTQAFSFSKIQSDFEQIDPSTGDKLPVDAEKSLTSIKSTLEDIGSGKLDLESHISSAINEAKGSSAKTLGDANIKSAIPTINTNKASVDGFAKNLGIKTAQGAKALAKAFTGG